MERVILYHLICKYSFSFQFIEMNVPLVVFGILMGCTKLIHSLHVEFLIILIVANYHSSLCCIWKMTMNTDCIDVWENLIYSKLIKTQLLVISSTTWTVIIIYGLQLWFQVVIHLYNCNERLIYHVAYYAVNNHQCDIQIEKLS